MKKLDVTVMAFSLKLRNFKKRSILERGRRKLLARFAYGCWYWLFSSTCISILFSSRAFSDNGVPSPPSLENEIDPQQHVNEEVVQKKIDMYVENQILELEKMGVKLTDEQKGKIRQQAFEDFKAIVEDQGYKVAPPAAPTGLRVITSE